MILNNFKNLDDHMEGLKKVTFLRQCHKFNYTRNSVCDFFYKKITVNSVVI